ncbi:MAG: type II toxin-antitoxin system Phd/YefM family antitoxin [Pyrinomonadaceae bacterium]
MSIKKANIGELKTHLSVYLKGVKNGGTVLVTERNKPVAKIVPLDADDEYETEEEQLIAEGILSPPKSNKPLPDSFWEDKDLPNVPMDVILRVIREERDED